MISPEQFSSLRDVMGLNSCHFFFPSTISTVANDPGSSFFVVFFYEAPQEEIHSVINMLLLLRGEEDSGGWLEANFMGGRKLFTVRPAGTLAARIKDSSYRIVLVDFGHISAVHRGLRLEACKAAIIMRVSVL